MYIILNTFSFVLLLELSYIIVLWWKKVQLMMKATYITIIEENLRPLFAFLSNISFYSSTLTAPTYNVNFNRVMC